MIRLATMMVLTLLSGTVPSPPDVRSFRPSQHGFKFRNAFTGSPLPISLGKLDQAVGIPDHYGLCGGMSAAAADFFLAARPIPAQHNVPTKGTDLYNYIFERQVNSLGDGLTQATKFAAWMSMPDSGPRGTRARSLTVVADVTRATRRGNPMMLGLVLTSRKAKGKLWENHQVLAYDLRESGSLQHEPRRAWSISIYDPNFPGSDDARLDMRLTLEGTTFIPTTLGVPGACVPQFGIQTTRRARGKPDTPVRGVFAMPYEPKQPGTHFR